MGNYLLGIDIGTTSSKGILADVDGRVVAHEQVAHSVATPRAGWFEQDAEAVWWGDFCRLALLMIRQSGIAPRHILGICPSALTPEMTPLDHDGRALRKAILYSDCRAWKETQVAVETVLRLRPKQYSPRLRSTHFVGPKLLWFRDNEPALFARTAVIHTGSSYLVYRLTGRHVISTQEANGFAPFYDAANTRWDEEMCAELGVPVSLFPDLARPTEVVGAVTAQAARETGLTEGTPVVAGQGDGVGETLATGALSPGDAILRYGTTGGFTVAVRADSAAATGGTVFGGIGLPGVVRRGGGMSASGALTTWFRNNLGQPEMEAEARLGISAYTLLSEEAWDIPPGSEGLVALPHFAGERGALNDPHARGLIIGLTLSHTRRHIYRALIESMGYFCRQVMEEAQAAGAEVKRIVATGGGTKSRLWVQVMSDVLGQDQEVIITLLGSPYGDAFLAGYGVGVFTDLSVWQTTWAPKTRKVTFSPAAKAVYDKYYPVYCRLYEQNKEAMHRLAELATR